MLLIQCLMTTSFFISNIPFKTLFTYSTHASKIGKSLHKLLQTRTTDILYNIQIFTYNSQATF